MDEEKGAFMACTFWMVKALAITGQIQRGRQLMGEAGSYASDLRTLLGAGRSRDERISGQLSSRSVPSGPDQCCALPGASRPTLKLPKGMAEHPMTQPDEQRVIGRHR